MSRPFPVLCRDCSHSEPEHQFEHNLRCKHPVVNANDPWALSSGSSFAGTSCREQRQSRSWFAPCGIKGKLWEPKHG